MRKKRSRHLIKGIIKAMVMSLLLLLCNGVLVMGQTTIIITDTGSGTFTVPDGVTSIKVECWGAGGAGGGSTTNNSGGSGGGGGAYTNNTYTSLSTGDVFDYTVGSGGTGSTSNGTEGGATTFSTLLTANGGGGGGSNKGTVGIGGTASGGDTNTDGDDGYTGGNSGGDGGDGANGGAGGTGSTNSDGSDGTSPGGGGGGGERANNGPNKNKTGGDGASGQITISWIDVSDFNVSASSVCTAQSSEITITSSTLTDGDYTLTYDLTGDNNETGTTSTITFSSGTATFSSSILNNEGSTILEVTSITFTGSSYSQDVSGNTPTITTTSAPSISSQPSTSTQNLCQYSTAVNLSITASGSGLSYQWYSNTTNTNSGGTLISGATSNNYTPSTSTAGTLYYYCIVTATGCSTTSNVSGDINISTAPSTTGITICEGENGSLAATDCGSEISDSEGPSYAGSGSNGTASNTEDWSNPGNVTANDGNRASIDNGNLSTSNYLQATNFDFDIPTNSTIVGIEVIIDRYSEAGGGPGDHNQDEELWLINKDGELSGDNKANAGTNWPTSEATESYGGSSDTWNGSLTYEDINNSNFGIALSVYNADINQDKNAYVDYIQITVYYTTPSGTISWYTSSTGGSSIGTGTSFNPVGVTDSGLSDTNTPGTTTYYAECSLSSGCRTATDFVINAAPTVSITGSSSITIDGTTTLSPTTGGTWTSSNTSVATVTSPGGVVTGVSTGSASFTFTETSTGCSNTTSLVSIYESSELVTSPGSQCNYAGSVDITVSANSTEEGIFYWYDNASGSGTALQISTQEEYSSSYLAENISSNQTFYVQIIVNGVSSALTPVTAYAITPPTLEASVGGSFCTGNTIYLSSTASDYDNIYWEGPNDFYSLEEDPTISNSTTDMSGTYTVYTNALSGINLITNGDFEDGNSAFTSSYTYIDSSSSTGIYGALSDEGYYTVVEDPSNTHTNFYDCEDHTSNGSMQMVINGADVTDVIVWSQTVNVVANTYYQFSYWVQSVELNNPSELQLYVNGEMAGSTYTASESTCDWNQYFYNWDSGSETEAVLSLINQNEEVGGNDFALDDIVFQHTCTASASVEVSVASGFTPDVSISADPSGTICTGDYVTFTATAVNGGTSPSYQWYSDGSAISGAISSTYTLASPTNGEVISCEMTSSLTCLTSSATATSESITIDITNVPTVDAGTEIFFCSSSSSVEITTGANASDYSSTEWSTNGTGTFSDNTSLTSCTYTPSSADITSGSITLTLTAYGNGSCANAISTKTLTLVPLPTVTVSLSSSDNDCPQLDTDQDFNPENGDYRIGYSQVVFQVSLNTTSTNWDFDFSISGGASIIGMSDVPSSSVSDFSSGTYTGLSGQDQLITLYIQNETNTELTPTFTIDNVTDNDIGCSSSSTQSATAHIKAMPEVGEFN
jgi:hypothetical protein